jgi:hypothetical protein
MWWISGWPRRGTRWAGLSARLDGEEVARVAVEFGLPAHQHRNVPLLQDSIQITRLEVRADRVGEGLGTETLAVLVSQFPTSDFWVHSDADNFYAKAGWQRFDRQDNSSGMATFYAFIRA